MEPHGSSPRRDPPAQTHRLGVGIISFPLSPHLSSSYIVSGVLPEAGHKQINHTRFLPSKAHNILTSWYPRVEYFCINEVFSDNPMNWSDSFLLWAPDYAQPVPQEEWGIHAWKTQNSSTRLWSVTAEMGHQEEMAALIHTLMFITTLFTIARIWEHSKCTLEDERV